MIDKDIKKTIKHCEWLSNNHCDIEGHKRLHKGICIAKGSVCSKIIDDGICPILIKLFKEEEG